MQESTSTLYHDGNRRLQDRFDSRRIADRLEEVTLHTAFSERDRELVAQRQRSQREPMRGPGSVAVFHQRVDAPGAWGVGDEFSQDLGDDRVLDAAGGDRDTVPGVRVRR